MSSNVHSYTAAGALPVKLLQDSYAMGVIRNGFVPMRHIQVVPTNRCNLKCPWCSCAKEDRSLELSYGDVFDLVYRIPKTVRAVTITGGGEPLLHPDILLIARLFRFVNSIKIGLVTNGTLVNKANPKLWENVSWCRISAGDGRNITKEYFAEIKKTVVANPSVDWAFSYVLSDKPDMDTLISVIETANALNFTHVRVVTDLLSVESSPIEEVEKILGKHFNLSKVIFQNRKKYEAGGKCWMGQLKPVIGADGMIYHCCGAQYALDPPSKKMPKELCLGNVKDASFSSVATPFDGSICKRCYYMDYNNLINMMQQKLDHSEWI